VVRDDLVASAAYQPEPTAAAAARRFVRDTLQSWVVGGAAVDSRALVDDAVLLTSELVTNAVVHAGTPVQVTCKLAAGEVEVVVSDAHPNRLVPEPAESEHSATERTSGRGLLLPAALANAWGVTYGQAAKAVWFRLGPGAIGWGSGLAEGLDTGLDELDTELAGGSTLAAAFSGSGAAPAFGATGAAGALEAAGAVLATDNGGAPPGAHPGYHDLLREVADSARAAVAAAGSFVLMADEDGDLRLQATSGAMPPPAELSDPAASSGRPERDPATALRASMTPAPSVLTVPFIVDGRVTGLLSAVSARPGAFGETESATLQRLADTCGPRLQRSWLDELERVRRGRIAALAQTRALLAGRLSRQEIMTLAGVVAVPRLAPWCALLLPEGDLPPDAEVAPRHGGEPGRAAPLRPAYVRHVDESRAGVLTLALTRACDSGPPPGGPAVRQAAGPMSGEPAARPSGGPGWPWRLALPTGPAAAAFAPGTAWCFPTGETGEAQGLLVIGTGRGGRLSREVAALAGDLAYRIGLALAGSAGLITTP
jgi:anti-sigma regulatory factor (Ser/Thr protein kinase)